MNPILMSSSNDPLDPPTRRGSVGSLVSAPGAEVAVAGVAPRESSSLQRAAGADRAAEAVENELAQTVPTTTTRQSTSSRYGASRVFFRKPRPINDFFNPLSL